MTERPARERIEALLKEHTKWPDTFNCIGCLPRFVRRGDCEDAAILTLALDADMLRTALEERGASRLAYIQDLEAALTLITNLPYHYTAAQMREVARNALAALDLGEGGCDHTSIAVKYRGVVTGELCTKCHSAQDSG